MLVTNRTRRPVRPAAGLPRFIPRLECLEDRLAPSGMNPLGAQDTLHVQPPPAQRFVNALDNFDMSSGQPLSIMLNNLAVNQFSVEAAMPPGQAQQNFALLLNQFLSNPQLAASAGALVNTEVQLAQDNLLLLLAIATNTAANPLLIQNIHNLQNAIQTNPVEGAANGPFLGALAFDLAVSMATGGG